MHATGFLVVVPSSSSGHGRSPFTRYSSRELDAIALPRRRFDRRALRQGQGFCSLTVEYLAPCVRGPGDNERAGWNPDFVILNAHGHGLAADGDVTVDTFGRGL